MTLIKCSECGREISARAASCPGCGNPINSQNPQEILKVEPQLVDKGWKKFKIISWLIIIFGFIFGFFLMSSSGDSRRFLFGLFISFVGFISLLVGEVGAWYEDRRAR